MKVKIVNGNGVKTVEEIRTEKMEMLKQNVIKSCTRSIAEADAIAYAGIQWGHVSSSRVDD